MARCASAGPAEARGRVDSAQGMGSGAGAGASASGAGSGTSGSGSGAGVGTSGSVAGVVRLVTCCQTWPATAEHRCVCACDGRRPAAAPASVSPEGEE